MKGPEADINRKEASGRAKRSCGRLGKDKGQVKQKAGTAVPREQQESSESKFFCSSATYLVQNVWVEHRRDEFYGGRVQRVRHWNFDGQLKVSPFEGTIRWAQNPRLPVEQIIFVFSEQYHVITVISLQCFNLFEDSLGGIVRPHWYRSF